MKIHNLRNATLIIDAADRRLLLDGESFDPLACLDSSASHGFPAPALRELTV